MTAVLPKNHKTAIDYLAISKSTPENRTATADVVREAIARYLEENRDELPPEALDALEDMGGDK